MAVRVTFLGSGDAFNAGARCQAAALVQAPSACWLLDCGADTLLALKRQAVPLSTVDAVCISHLHGDHFAGMPSLYLESLFGERRERPLTLVGPPGTGARVDAAWRALYQDLSALPLPFEVRCLELEPGVPIQVGAVALQPFRVPHQATDVSLGLRLTVDGKTILYSGDTGWTEELVVQSQDTDLFICECSFFDTRMDSHLDYPRLAEHRHRFGCRRLVLTHCGREVLARRGEIPIELADDGLVIEL